MPAGDFHALVDAQVALLGSRGDDAVSERRKTSATSALLELKVQYCGVVLRWEVCCFEAGIDLVPVDVGLASQEDAYEVFALASMPAVQAWLPSNPKGLVDVAADIRGTFSAHQRQTIEKHPNRAIAFNFDAIKHRDGLECCVRQRAQAATATTTSTTEVVFDFPLFDPAPELDARLLPIRICIRVPAEGSSGGGGTLADVKLVLPRHVTMRLTGAYLPKPWNLDGSLWDYLPAVQEYVRNAWAKRKELTQALVATYNVLEYDAVDYSAVHLMAKQKLEKQPVVRLLEFSFTLDFPEKAPQMTIHEFAGSRVWKLDTALYRYSPRWTAHRMGEELFVHALAHSQAWTAP